MTLCNPLLVHFSVLNSESVDTAVFTPAAAVQQSQNFRGKCTFSVRTFLSLSLSLWFCVVGIITGKNRGMSDEERTVWGQWAGLSSS